MGKETDIKKYLIEKGRFVLKILIWLIIGFLPSFIFIALFVQYGSPFANYIKFLSDFSSSWIAWVSAIAVAFLIHFVGKTIKSMKNLKKTIKDKFRLIILILSIVIGLLLISAQLYLYVNFVLGSDVLVRLSADKDNIFFNNNPSKDITFKISITMNPFCSAQCKYEFFDISSGEEIDSGLFNITSILSKSKEYSFNNNYLVEGSQTLNRFEVSCKSKRTILCYTSEEESKRAVLVTLNYKLDEEDSEFKNNSKQEIISLGQTLYSIDKRLNNSANNLNSINGFFITDYFLEQSEELSSEFFELNDFFKDLKELWRKQNFISLKEELPAFETETENLNVYSDKLDSDIILDILIYNNLIENLTNSRKILEEISQKSLTDFLCKELNNVIHNFNEVIQKFKEKTTLSDKISLVENISLEIKELYEDSSGAIGIDSSCSLDEEISESNLTKIEINYFDESPKEIFLEEQIPVCCFFDECEKCCDEGCSDENYPVIFLHGHSVNKALPADYSLDALARIKEKLVYEDYIDAGAVVISPVTEQEGLWGKVNAPITITASYFFDTYKTETGERTVSSNKDSIDTYAIRLKNIVDLVKYRTNKNKVIIVAHSMGGLVTRRYIQIFGADDVDKAILITVPNHGITDKVRDYCALLGPTVACNEMDKDSIFINKLNNAPTENVPTYNIVGVGCDMGAETGDGIIKNSSQYLESAINYYMSGGCNELNFEFLHGNIVYPEKYPEVYYLIKEIIIES